MSIEKTSCYSSPPPPKLTPKKLRAIIEKEFPQFVEAVKKAKEDNVSVCFHQDAFASDLNEDELDLLALSVKYAGMMGVNLIILTENSEADSPVEVL